MSKKRLYAANGEYIGERVDQGARVRLYSFNGTYLGEYVKSMDKTYDSQGKHVGFGDLLAILIKI
jgi:hypothetical protein